jgi:hypothetical protein
MSKPFSVLEAAGPEPNLTFMTDGKAVQRERRDERLAAELRENLRRRKAQARARATQGTDQEAEPAPNSAGIAAEKRDDGTGSNL